jgi:hypothetical protein
MRSALYLNVDKTTQRSTALVADPLSKEVLSLWEGTAKRNREIYTEVFRLVPLKFGAELAGVKVRRDVWCFVVGECRLRTDICS